MTEEIEQANQEPVQSATPPTPEEMMAVAALRQAGVITLDEARQYLGLEPLNE